MEHIAVESSQIASIAHEPSSGTMQVLFRRGGLYEYEGVSQIEFEAVRNPALVYQSSVSKAFDAVIKRSGKPYRKLLRGTTGDLSMPPPLTIEEVAPATGEPIEAAVASVEIVSQKAAGVVDHAATLQVTDQATQVEASDALLTIAAMRREIGETFKPMKDAAYRAHKVICEQERMLDLPLETVEKVLKNRISGFVIEQRRLAALEEQRLRQVAEAEAAERAAKETVDQAIEQAIDLEARGQTAAAEAVLAAPAPVPARYIAPAPVAPAVAQVKGVTMRTDWDFRITNINLIPREYLVINESAIRQLGKNTQGRAQVPGVEFFPKPVVAASRRG